MNSKSEKSSLGSHAYGKQKGLIVKCSFTYSFIFIFLAKLSKEEEDEIKMLESWAS